MPQCAEASHQYDVVARAIRFLREHANQQPELSDVAAAVGLSESRLQRVFSDWAGVSPKRFLQYLTKEHARRQLRAPTDVLTTSIAVGLSGPGRLHDLMVSCEAMTPGEIQSGAEGVEVRWGTAATPFGSAVIGWTSRGICFLQFSQDDIDDLVQRLRAQWPRARFVHDDAAARQTAGQVFGHHEAPGKLHVLLRGTNFQIKVWEALLEVPAGQVLSYGQLAARAGNPRAARAVGSAIGANQIGYLIPCHRIIRESGESGQYRWGPERKAAMLGWEASQLAAGAADR